jgi:hypothetical protein
MCPHIDRFYQGFASPVKVFWPVELETLPPHKIEQKTSKLGDECHHNITGLSNRNAEKYFRSRAIQPEQCSTCEGATERILTIEDLNKMRERFPPIGRPPREE